MNPEPQSVTCPKCQGPMRAYERSGVHIDQCVDCRGVFLDRGELEHLIDSESAFYQSGPAQTSPAYQGAGYDNRRDDRHFDSREYDRRGHDGYRGHDGRSGHYKKKKSFLSELFD